MSKKQSLPLTGYPWTGRFKTVEEIKAYFDHEKLTCLLCGREFHNLALHVSTTHEMHKDDYKERFGIPWSYGLAGKKFKEHGSKHFKEMRESGKLARSPSKAHIQKLHAANNKKRPPVEAFRNDSRRKLLATHGRTDKWSDADLEEFLERIASGRTPMEVSTDKDMPCAKVFYDRVNSDSKYRKRYEQIWNNLHYEVHIRAGKPSKKFENEVVRLRRKGMTLPEIAEQLEVGVHAVRCAWHRLKKQGRLKESDKALEYKRYTRKDYEEYLRRIASGRMITDVGRDPDMPQSDLFYIYLREHLGFKKKFKAMWETLPYEQQARSRRMGERFKKDVKRLHKKGHSWEEIGEMLGINPTLAKSHYQKA